MPVPVFVALSLLRTASAISTAAMAENLGISSSFLFYLEEFEKTVSYNMQVKGKKWGEKTTIGERIEEWLRVNPVPQTFSINLYDLENRLTFESLYLSIWPHIEPLFNIDHEPFFYQFMNYIFWEKIEDDDLGYFKKYYEGYVISPSDIEIAKGLYWVLSRRWGKASTLRRHEKKDEDAVFVPFFDNIYSVKPGEKLGKLKINKDTYKKTMNSFKRLLFFLYIHKIYLIPSQRTNLIREQWAKWKSKWLQRNEYDSIPHVMWLEVPENAPKPQIIIVFNTPHGYISVCFEALIADNPDEYPYIGFYMIKGDIGPSFCQEPII